MLPRARSRRPVRPAAADHRRGHRGRGAGHPGRQQAARRAEGRGGQGARLRRPPQGDARGHRHPDRRPGHLRGSRHQARERHARHARHRQAGHHHQGRHDDHRGRRQEGRHQGPLQPDPRPDRGDHLRLRPGEAAGAAGEARRRRCGDPGRRRHRDRGEGEEGPGRRRDARDPRRGRGRHRSRRRRRSALCRQGARTVAAGERRPEARASTSSAGRCRRRCRQIAENAGVDGAVVAGKLLERNDDRRSASTPRPRPTSTCSRPASSTRPRWCAPRCRTRRRSPAC